MVRFCMSWPLVAFLIHLISLAAAYPVSTEWDVVVVGGGPAGLSATSGLARVRRKVLMLDSGEYRNAQTRHMHDVIGNDGTVPAVFRALARQQISRYPTVQMMNATVTQISGGASSGFSVQTAQGQIYTARKIVLATGMKDVLPSTPGVAEYWGKGIFWCPWCDGYEHRDQPYGIIGPYDKVLGTVFEVATQETDIIALVNGTQTPEQIAKMNSDPADGYNDWEEKLKAYNVVVENRTIACITRIQDGGVVQSPDGMTEYDKFLVTFTDGGTLERNAFITNFPVVQRSTLGEALGIPYDSKQHLKTDSVMESMVKGIFVVGDANADNSTNVPHAMWSGKRAAVQIQVALEEEHSDVLIGKRSLPLLEDEVSELMGRDLRDIYDRLVW